MMLSSLTSSSSSTPLLPSFSASLSSFSLPSYSSSSLSLAPSTSATIDDITGIDTSNVALGNETIISGANLLSRTNNNNNSSNISIISSPFTTIQSITTASSISSSLLPSTFMTTATEAAISTATNIYEQKSLSSSLSVPSSTFWQFTNPTLQVPPPPPPLPTAPTTGIPPHILWNNYLPNSF